jgi:hypothetical protein
MGLRTETHLAIKNVVQCKKRGEFMKLRISLVVALVVLTSSMPAYSSCEFPAAYFFGASNLDTGNFLNHPHWSTQPYAPTPGRGYWMGRWQSGPVWADAFAGALGLPSTASSDGGTNYAFGAASTSPHPGETPVLPDNPGHDLYLSTQIDQALADASNNLDPAAIYVFEIGHNDVNIIGRTAEDGPDGGGVVVTQMQRLRDAGAAIFLVRLLGAGFEPYATPFNQAILAGAEDLRDDGATVYVVSHVEFAAQYLTASYLATIGITQFGGVHCRGDAACQAAAITAAQSNQPHDNAYLFFDQISHWNHKVHADMARHALAQIPACENVFIDSFESS